MNSSAKFPTSSSLFNSGLNGAATFFCARSSQFRPWSGEERVRGEYREDGGSGGAGSELRDNAASARGVGCGDLEEGVCFDVLGASGSGAQPPVRILHQQLPQQVLGGGFNHGGVRRVAAQNASDGGKNEIIAESNTLCHRVLEFLSNRV